MQSLKKIENYILEEKIGEGSFGQVYKAQHTKTGEHFAIKVIPKSATRNNKLMRRQLKNETQILGQTRHRNLMHLHKSFETERNYYLVLDYCPEGDLEKFILKNTIKFFSEFEALSIIKQIMNGFQELRRKNVMHRDLKLENIFIKGQTVVLGDFGAAKVVRNMTTTTVGTPTNMAPEILKGDDYNHKSDLWSIGIVLYRLLIGKSPFYALNIGALKHMAVTKSGKNLDFKGKTHFCEHVKDLLRKLLEPEPKERISWKDFFNHFVFSDAHKITCGQMISAPNSPQVQRFSVGNPDFNSKSNISSFL